MSISLAAARAAASRRNGAKSCGPKTPEGKQRSSQNALKHGFRAQKHVVLAGEDGAEFAALEAALLEELAPEGALQSVLAQRVVAATWRLARADRLETELFAENRLSGRSLGLALIRDCNGARAFDTLLRYRGGTLAELWRALRLLKALQAEMATAPDATVAEQPIEPDGRRIAGEIALIPAAAEPDAASGRRADRPRLAAEGVCAQPQQPASPAPQGDAVRENPIEPEPRRNPGQTFPLAAASEQRDPPGRLASKRPACETQGSITEGHHGDPTGGAQPNHA